MKYYVRAGERNLGPFSLDDLRQRGLGPDEYVWSDGMTDWRRAADVPELAQIVKSPAYSSGPAAYASGPPAYATGHPTSDKYSPYSSPTSGDYMDYGNAGAPRRDKPHSGFGIASCIIGGAMTAIVVAVFIMTMVIVGDAQDPKDLEHRPIFMALGFTMCGSPMFYILGLILGIVGWMQPERSKLFGIIGTIGNALLLMGMLGFLLLSLAVAAAGK